MPSITLSAVVLAAPDGRPLLPPLDLSLGAQATGLIGRNGVGKTTLLSVIAGERPPAAGAVRVTGRLGVFRQAVRADPGARLADLFGAAAGLAVLRRAEQGLASAEDLAQADWTLEQRLADALDRAGLGAGPDTPLAALCGGERTRAALAALVFDRPDFLLIDEPTNNLDRSGRQALGELLSGWKGGALVVTHDRELLERMEAIVELTPLGAHSYGGGWSLYRQQKALELAAAEQDLAEAEKQLGQAQRQAQHAIERKARKDGVGQRRGEKGGMPRIALGRLKEVSQNTSGEAARLAADRKAKAGASADAARARLEVIQPFTVSLASTGLASGRLVASLERVTAGHEPGRPVLRDLSFQIQGPERIALTGANGTGKTTLLAVLSGALAPWSGKAEVKTPFALLDQQVSLLEPAASIRDNFLRLNPGAGENDCRAALARFMFRADAALSLVSDLSGGQVLRAGLACVLGGPSPPPLLILDEPTNHLDLDSIAAVEAGLAAYDGALVVVSHDQAFLDALDLTRRLGLPLDDAGP